MPTMPSIPTDVLEPIEIVIALVGAVIAVVWFLYPEGREKVQVFFRRLISHSFSREAIKFLIPLFLGAYIGFRMFFSPPPEDMLKTIRSRENGQGMLFCGINGSLEGFSFQGEDGIWAGIDVDYCRALAAAILDDPNKVHFVRLETDERFNALKEGRVDVLFRNTSWTVWRALQWDIDFGPPIFIDNQIVIAHADSQITDYEDLEGKRICVLKKTTSYPNLIAFLSKQNIKPKEIVLTQDGETVFTHNSEVVTTYLSSAPSPLGSRYCDAMTSDRSQIFAQMHAKSIPYNEQGFEGHKIIGDSPISKELLAPAFRTSDKNWGDIITYIVWATMYAEELDITSYKVKNYNNSSPLEYRQLLGIDAVEDAPDEQKIDKHIGEMLGLNADFVFRVIDEVGNYGEIYERNLTEILGEDRGPNQIWTDSNNGILYPPPFTIEK